MMLTMHVQVDRHALDMQTDERHYREEQEAARDR